MRGRKRVPKTGSFIAAANHVSLGDPPAVTAVRSQRFISFMAKRELFEGKRWGWWFKAMNCIPTNRDGNDVGAVKEAIKRLKNGGAVAIFPEGTRSVNGDFGKPQVGIGFVQDKTGVPVIPFYVQGTDKALPKGGKYKVFSPVAIYVGENVDLSGAKEIENNRERYQYISNKVMEAIATIKRQVEEGTFKD